MDFKNWWERLCGIRHGPWLLAGILVMALLSLVWQTPITDGDASQQERRMAQVLSQIQGAGQVEVALYYSQREKNTPWEETEAAPVGAVIVSQGGEDIAVRLQLIRAVSTLLGLKGDQICVFPMEEGGTE